MDQLIEVFRPGQIPQLVNPHILERYGLGGGAPEEFGRRLGSEDLAPMGRFQDSGYAVDGRPKVIPVTLLRFAGVYGDADAQRARGVGGCGRPCHLLLNGNGCGGRGRGCGERAAELVSHGFEDVAA